jgi:hypothetical protein
MSQKNCETSRRKKELNVGRMYLSRNRKKQTDPHLITPLCPGNILFSLVKYAFLEKRKEDDGEILVKG